MDQTNYTTKLLPEQVSNSVECTRSRKYARFYAFLCVVLLLEVAVLGYILNVRDDLQHKVEVYAILCAMFGWVLLLMISQIIYHICRIKAIENGVGTLPVYKVTFENVNTSIWRGTCFVVEIPDGSGNFVKTRPIFMSQKPTNLIRPNRTFIPALYVDDFRGREVLVMYNPTKNKVCVLGLAENFSLPVDML